MKSNIEYYLVEGECEDQLVKSSSLIGRVEFLDLSEKSVEQINRWSTKLSGNKKKIFLNIVFDTDVLLNDRTILFKFLENIRFLKKKGFNVRLLQQHKNFEEELCFCLKVNKSKLFDKFSARNNREFKQNFIAEKKAFVKLQELNPSFTIWSSLCISELQEFEKLIHNYDKLPKKPSI